MAIVRFRSVSTVEGVAVDGRSPDDDTEAKNKPRQSVLTTSVVGILL